MYVCLCVHVCMNKLRETRIDNTVCFDSRDNEVILMLSFMKIKTKHMVCDYSLPSGKSGLETRFCHVFAVYPQKGYLTSLSSCFHL